MAEREGFEPSEHLLGAHTISNRAPSASRASLRVDGPGTTGVSPVPNSWCAVRTLPEGHFYAQARLGHLYIKQILNFLSNKFARKKLGDQATLRTGQAGSPY